MRRFFIMCRFVFFFKQKTAYEMRISDWSSDVCSSDLLTSRSVCHSESAPPSSHRSTSRQKPAAPSNGYSIRPSPTATLRAMPSSLRRPPARSNWRLKHNRRRGAADARLQHAAAGGPAGGRRGGRSEEHTSELQSLMRISYAVFCLKKK